MPVVLNQKFFEKPTVTVAKKLLGKYLCRRYRGKIIRAMITEVEAYDGPHDKASHASRGLTSRTKVMFGPAGYWYVYFTYGRHWMLNVVTGKTGYPAAVLIRGVQLVEVKPPYSSAIINYSAHRINGPGRVTKFFKIDKKFNEKPLNRRIGLWIEDGGVKIRKNQVARSKRIGVDYAGPVWSKKQYRFFIHSPLDEK